MPKLAWCSLLLLTSCATVSRHRSVRDVQGDSPLREARAPQPVIQGFIGITELSGDEYDLDPSVGTDVESFIDTLPVLGFAVQRPLRGDRLQLGIEGGASVSFEGDRGFVTNGSMTVVVSDNDLFLLDLFAGPVVSAVFGTGTRVFASAGPVLQWGRVDLEFDDGMGGIARIGESGFGTGVYARAGIEFPMQTGTWVGLTVGYKDVSIDPGGALDEFEFESTQLLLSATRRF